MLSMTIKGGDKAIYEAEDDAIMDGIKLMTFIFVNIWRPYHRLWYCFV